MKAIIQPSKIKGSLKAPPSKSYAHRMLLGAAFSCRKAGRESLVRGISSSEDMLATMDCLRALGFEIRREEETVRIRRGEGTVCSGLNPGSFAEGRASLRDQAEASFAEGEEASSNGAEVSLAEGEKLPVFPCRESGSTLRFFLPVALALAGGGVFTGTQRLMERGIGVYEEIFSGSGILLETCPEMIRLKGELKSGTYRIRGDVSSQFVTGMLFALSLLDGESRIEVLPPVESRSYIDITIDVMKSFGVFVEEVSENCFRISGSEDYRAGEYEVEGDWSNAAFLYAFNALGAELEISGLNPESKQGDKACAEIFDVLSGKKRLPEGEARIDISNVPDLGPVLFAAAAALQGGSFTGIRRLRIKESDRAAAMEAELQKFGIRSVASENEMEILPSLLMKPSEVLSGHNDHRIVMALSVLACLKGAEIEDAEAVRKSWPEFFEIMKAVGMDVVLE